MMTLCVRCCIGLLLLCAVARAETPPAEERGGDSFLSVNVGPSVKAWNYAGLTKETPLNDNVTLYVTGGLGTILFGGGAAWYSDRFDTNGFVAAVTFGIVGFHGGLAHQWMIGDRSSLSAGVTYGVYFMQYEGFLPVLSYERRF